MVFYTDDGFQELDQKRLWDCVQHESVVVLWKCFTYESVSEIVNILKLNHDIIFHKGKKYWYALREIEKRERERERERERDDTSVNN